MRQIDISSWASILSTVVGLALVTLIGVGIRLLVMVTVQQRRERANRQINERLKTLIAAYRTIGGSFTGDLEVDPRHLRDLQAGGQAALDLKGNSERARRIRDAVEAALSDIILLGTEEQVRLAAEAARELAAGRPVHTSALVVSLRAFIRDALDLDPVPEDVEIPRQGPGRPQAGGSRGGRGEEGRGGGGGGGAGGGAMAGGMGGGMAMGAGLGAGGVELAGHGDDDTQRDDVDAGSK